MTVAELLEVQSRSNLRRKYNSRHPSNVCELESIATLMVSISAFASLLFDDKFSILTSSRSLPWWNDNSRISGLERRKWVATASGWRVSSDCKHADISRTGY